MSEEKKNEVTEVVEEEARGLSEEELAQVSGGVGAIHHVAGIRLELEIE